MPIQDEELKEEMREDMLADARADELHDAKMRSDYDEAYEHFDFNEDMTIAEFKDAVKDLKEYWDVDEKDIFDSL